MAAGLSGGLPSFLPSVLFNLDTRRVSQFHFTAAAAAAAAAAATAHSQRTDGRMDG